MLGAESRSDCRDGEPRPSGSAPPGFGEHRGLTLGETSRASKPAWSARMRRSLRSAATNAPVSSASSSRAARFRDQFPRRTRLSPRAPACSVAACGPPPGHVSRPAREPVMRIEERARLRALHSRSWRRGEGLASPPPRGSRRHTRAKRSTSSQNRVRMSVVTEAGVRSTAAVMSLAVTCDGSLPARTRSNAAAAARCAASSTSPGV